MLKPAANVNEVTFPTKTGATFKFFNFGATFNLKKQDQLQDFFRQKYCKYYSQGIV